MLSHAGAGATTVGTDIIVVTATGSGDQVSEFPVPGNAVPYFICRGSDGSQWFSATGPAAHTYSTMTKITTDGTMTSYHVPSVDEQPYQVAEGADHNVWFLDDNQRTGAWSVGRITTSGDIREFPVTPPSSAGGVVLTGLAQGADGRMWVSVIDTDAPASVDHPSVTPVQGHLVAISEDSGQTQSIPITRPGYVRLLPTAIAADASGDVSFIAAAFASQTGSGVSVVGTYGPTSVTPGAVTPPPGLPTPPPGVTAQPAPAGG